MKKTKFEAKLTRSSENFSKLKGKTHNFEKKVKNSSKKLKVLANPLGLLAENRSNKKAWSTMYARLITTVVQFEFVN